MCQFPGKDIPLAPAMPPPSPPPLDQSLPEQEVLPIPKEGVRRGQSGLGGARAVAVAQKAALGGLMKGAGPNCHPKQG